MPLAIQSCGKYILAHSMGRGPLTWAWWAACTASNSVYSYSFFFSTLTSRLLLMLLHSPWMCASISLNSTTVVSAARQNLRASLWYTSRLCLSHTQLSLVTPGMMRRSRARMRSVKSLRSSGVSASST